MLCQTENIINRIQNNTSLPNGIRSLIPQQTRILLNIRNQRDVAHVGGEVNSNYSDSLFVLHAADWILIEIIRNYHTNSIDEAQKIVDSINETKIPIITEVDGFVRVQNTELDAKDKTLIILYYKYPNKVKDTDLAKWIRYSNMSRYRSDILKKLDNEALIHYENNFCLILQKGILYVEKNINFEVII